MSRMKTFFKYAMWIILFFVFSELITYVGLNSSYKNIDRKDNISQVEITQAQATLVNGRMKGTIKASKEDYLTGKYVKVDFYSKRNIKLGTKYIEILTNESQQTQDFSAYFELQDVSSYEVSIVSKKDKDSLEIDFIPEEMSKREIFFTVLITYLIFW